MENMNIKKEYAFEEKNQLPLFSQIKVDHIVSSVRQSIAENKKLMTCLLDNDKAFTWQNLIQPLDEADDLLSKLWSPITHMNAVVSEPKLRKAHDDCLPLFSEYGTYVGQHEGLYQAYLSISKSMTFKDLKLEQQQVIQNALRDFTLAGIALSEEKKIRYGEIKKQLSQLTSQFSNNVMDATLAWSKLVTDVKQLQGLPESALQGAQQAAKEKGVQGYLFTLDIPSYLPVITYAKNRELRHELYKAFTTRASDQGPNAGEFDNTEIINSILSLRHELALLLDFKTYSAYSLATKMAETPEQVVDFLTELAKKSRVQGVSERDAVMELARENDNIEHLEAWDIGYYAELLKQQRYQISDEMVRPYFPENKVLSGLFEVVKRLFSISIKEQFEFDSWHKDVRFFHIYNAQEQHIGSFYLDLYAREFKRGGAWMNDCRVRRRQCDATLQLPVAYLTCNFNKPVGNNPALFTHNEVITLFHEFGHGLHHMLTKIESASVSGINGVPWDAVELPSQFLENWCWEPKALALISGHVETGEPLPKHLLDKMLQAKNFNSALMMLRQLELSLFDFAIHSQDSNNNPDFVMQILADVRSRIAVFTTPAFNRFQHGFSHIFAGGYAAGYYSYKWAEVLSADAFSRFEKEGIFNTSTGHDFLEAILEKGGSVSPMQLFKNFMGREPSINALLRHSGIA